MPKEMNATLYMEAVARAASGIRAADAAGRELPLNSAAEAGCALMQGCALKGNTVILIGNGGSAAIASHIAVDLMKNGGVRTLAFNDPSLLTCIGNDLGYAAVFETPIAMMARQGDLLIAISSSGASENILRAVAAARKAGASVITMSGFASGNPLSKLGDLNFYVDSASYGPVEIMHTALCHCLLDLYMIKSGKLDPRKLHPDTHC